MGYGRWEGGVEDDHDAYSSVPSGCQNCKRLACTEASRTSEPEASLDDDFACGEEDAAEQSEADTKSVV